MSESTDERRLLLSLIDRTLACEVQHAGVTPISDPHATGWRTLPGAVTAEIVGGCDLMEFDDRPTVRSGIGDAICVRAGVRHRFILATAKAVSRWSHIQWTVLGGLDLLAAIDPPLVIPGPAAVALGDANQALAETIATDSLVSIARRRSACYRLLEVIIGACPEPARGLGALRAAERLAPALARIDARLDDPGLGMAELARSCRLSPSRFHAVFKEALGEAPVRWVQRRRMARAEQLLLAGELKVHEVGERCGWTDPFHFSRLFKRLHGVSPQGYREQALARGW